MPIMTGLSGNEIYCLGLKGFAPGAPLCETPWLSPCAASIFHSYQYRCTCSVKLTVTDVGGNEASVAHTVTVEGPPSPSEAREASHVPSSPSPALSTSPSGSTASGSRSGSGAGSKPVANPIASAAGTTPPRPETAAMAAAASP